MNLLTALEHLSGGKPCDVDNALFWLRSIFVKQPMWIAKIRQHGGLLVLLRVVGAGSSNVKHTDMALSILANCATENATCAIILKQNGVRILGNLLPTIDQSSIQNRICRLLANLSQDPKCCQVIHDNGELDVLARDMAEKEEEKSVEEEEAAAEETPTIVQQIIKLLADTTDVECQQTYLRTIRLLCDTPVHQERVIAEGALKVVCLCLKSTDDKVLTVTLTTLAHLIKSVDKEAMVWQLINGEGSSSLVSIATTNPSLAIARTASSILLHFAKEDLLSPMLLGAEALGYFLEKAVSESDPTLKKICVSGICLCCKDVDNRRLIREAEGLKLLLGCLDDAAFCELQNQIISSLVFFLHDEAGMDNMRSSGLVSVMLKQLRREARLDGKEGEGGEEGEEEEYGEGVKRKLMFTIGGGKEEEEDEEEDSRDKNESPIKELKDTKDIEKESTSVGSDIIAGDISEPMDEQEEVDSRHQSESPSALPKVMKVELAPERKDMNATNIPEPMDVTTELCSSISDDKPVSSTEISTSEDITATDHRMTQDAKQEEPRYSTDGPRNIMAAHQLSPGAGFNQSSSPMPGSSSPGSGSRAGSPGNGPLRSSPRVFSDDDLSRPTPLTSSTSSLEWNSNAVTPKSLTPSTSMESLKEGQKQTPRTKGLGKRRRSQTPDEKSRIERRLSTSSLASSSSFNMNELMDQLQNTTSPKSGGTLDGIDIDKYKDPRKATEHNVLLILARLSFADDPSADIVQRDVIETLLDYVTKATDPFPKASRILSHVSTNPQCFHKMLLVRYPCLLEEKLGPHGDSQEARREAGGESARKRRKHDTSDGSPDARSKQPMSLYNELVLNMMTIAETLYGRGVLERLLQPSQPRHTRTSCALCIPYFCRSDAMVAKILSNTTAVHTLCQCLLDPTEQSTAISSILYLLGCLQKPQLDEDSGDKASRKKDPGAIIEKLDALHDMSFILDDGSRIPAHRQTMIESSQVFSAMLEGHFAEAEQSEVSLSKVDKNAMVVLIDCLEGSVRLFEDECTKAESVETTLHLLELSHRYMITDVFSKSLNAVRTKLFSRNTLERIMTFFQNHHLRELAVACIRYVLWGEEFCDMDRKEIIVSSLQDDERKEVFVDVLEDVLMMAVRETKH